MSNNLSPADQQEVARFQQLQQNLEAVIQQRVTMENQVREMEFAVKELDAASEDAVVYKAVGGIFIKSEQKSLLSSTAEKKETLDMRVKSLLNQEQRLKKQFEELRIKVQGIFQGK